MSWPERNLKEWNDEDRMLNLFNDLPEERYDDPDSYDDKIGFWQKAIINFCKESKLMSFNFSLLKKEFERNGKFPRSLNKILLVMEHNKALERESNFWYRHSNVKSKLKSWVAYPFQLTFQMFGSEDSQSFVVNQLIESEGLAILKHFQNTNNPLCSFSEFQKVGGWSLKDTNIIIHSLLEKKLISVHQNQDGNIEVIKFSRQGEVPSPVSQTDLSIIHILATLQRLEQRNEKFTEQAEKMKYDAAKQLKLGNRERALSFLRHKKQITSRIDKHYHAIHQLESILLQIENSQSDREILAAMSSGSKALQNLLTDDKTGKSIVETIDEVLDNVEESLSDAQAANDAMTSGMNAIQPSTIEEDEEINRQFEELENELTNIQFPETPISKIVITNNKNQTPIPNKNQTPVTYKTQTPINSKISLAN
eukprot:c7588_g1_i1.p1 GENE.c7588_g1_i1~~c7588_g1_i1.p1  ORF type:complete len:423 (-),score=155.63 c7588_g1_i1:38-1306(-)